MMKADWKQGVWTSAAIESGEKLNNNVRVTIGSDWLPLRAFEEVIKQDPVAVYGDLLPVLRQSDLNIVNIECTLGETGSPIPKAGPNFQATEDSVRSLVEVPFHVACMANNHIMDYGPDSLSDTIRVLQEAGLHTVGAAMTGEEVVKPLSLDVRGVKLAIINFSEGEACVSLDNGPGAYGFHYHQVANQVQQLKHDHDIVLVIFHGGREYTPLPPEYVMNALRHVAEAGASAVIAHHPHVPQGIEIHHNVPIVYSQGNFVFWQEGESFYKHAGYLVHLDLFKQDIMKMEITPYIIRQTGLERMKEPLKSVFLDTMHKVSQLLAHPKHVRHVWDAFIDTMGVQGLKNTLERTIKRMEVDEKVGAAQLQNLFFTPAHSELFIRGLARASLGKDGDSPQWAKELVNHWLQCTMEEVIRQSSIQTEAKTINIPQREN